MVIERKADAKRRSSDVGSTNHLSDPILYFLTTGSAKTLWWIFTLFNGSYVELIPVFDSEKQAITIMESLHDKTGQVEPILLSRLKTLPENQQMLFILNPKAEIQGGQMYLREGSNWGLTIDELSGLLDSSVQEEKVCKL